MTEERCYHTIDKSTWGKGPWLKEPDKVQWMDRTGLPCLAVRHPTFGHWCGYVGVPRSHRLYGGSYEDQELVVHGGLTFNGPCSEKGDDCAHCEDYSPVSAEEKMAAFLPGWGMPETFKKYLTKPSAYRTLRYVREQCHLLAMQLKDAA